MTSGHGMTRTNDFDVTLVMSHVTPVLGMEKAALRLVEVMDEMRVRIVVAGDDVDSVGNVSIGRLGNSLRGWRRALSVPRFRRWLRSPERGLEPLIAVGVWAAVPLILASLGTATGPIVVWEHSLGEAKVRSIRTLGVLDRIARLVYRRAEVVVGVSDAVTARMASRSRRVETIGNVVDAQVATCADAASEVRDERLLLMVGSLTPTKNQMLALESLPRLAPSMRLTILGDGRDRGRLEDATRRLGITERVEFVGVVEPSDVERAMRRARLLVHPSLGETFGYVLFEACAARLPVVAVAAPVMDSFVGRYVPGRVSLPTPKEYADAISAELDVRHSDREWRDSAEEIRNSFSPGAVAAQWRSLLSSL